MKGLISVSLVFVFALAVALAGCDTTVDTFLENGRYHSVFGYLSVGADTQWIRVEPLRDSVLLGARPGQNLTVRIEHPVAGETVALNDSVFRVNDGLYAHNYWTAYPVELKTRYRIEVTDPDGGVSYAEMTTPESFPDPEILHLPDLESCQWGSQRPMYVNIPTRDRLLVLSTYYDFFDWLPPHKNGDSTVSHLRDVRPTPTGYEAYIDWVADVGPCAEDVKRFDLIITFGGSDWPEEAFDPEMAALPDVGTNVRGGTGFFGGITTKTFNIFDR